ncbi:unnamed protein product [Arctia plantaginis]|uniref:Uncharacterized protein n=1 Tax=Arctia plantaginis TaxID=874455 RepID=A0A8S1BCH4_ARCPL|nr:unnamed protein product [Arctia plantaginis]
MIQVGSRSAMFSPLYINTASTPNELEPDGPRTFSPVSPQMIYESLRKLSVWRQYIMTGDLMDYIRRNYPVNPVEAELYPELKEKLRVATIAGIVIEPYEDNWCLTCALKDRQLSPNHVSLFWEAYLDNMNPLRCRKLQAKEVDSAGTEEPPAKGNDHIII